MITYAGETVCPYIYLALFRLLSVVACLSHPSRRANLLVDAVDCTLLSVIARRGMPLTKNANNVPIHKSPFLLSNSRLLLFIYFICLPACLFQKGLACKSFNVNLFANLTSGNGNCSIFWIRFSYVCLFVLINATVFNCHNRTEPSENREILSPPH